MTKPWVGMALAMALTGGAAWAKDSVKPKGPDEDGTKAALTSIAGEGFYNSSAFAYLTELSDNVGGRVTGSPAGQKAIDWGVEKMKGIGLANVHTEKYSVWKGWTRGTASVQMLAPLQRKIGRAHV